VLSEYGTIDAIPDSAAAWRVSVRGAAALAESLAGLRAEALLYKRLASLRMDVPLTENLSDLRYRGAVRAPFEALAAELSDSTLIERVPQFV
jgi:hypothetical protein